MAEGEAVRQTAVEIGAAGLVETGRGMEELETAGALADAADDLRN